MQIGSFMAIFTKKKDPLLFKEQARIKSDDILRNMDSVKVIENDNLIGKHVFGDMYNVDKNAIDDVDYLKKVIEECIGISGTKLMDMKSVEIGGRKGGISVIALMDTGHAALHAWHTDNYVTFDIFTFGGETEPGKAFDYIVSKLRPKRHKAFVMDRSQIST